MTTQAHLYKQDDALKVPAVTTELLSLDDIAGRWQVSRDYAQRYLVKRPGFPEPAPGSTRKKQRWLAKDIDNFLTSGEETPA